ncbi:MAG: hypothetical protein ISF22_04860 [Methanomassiliicoccus sp.]|nr:hypothetical protein [Methanomassiliicoccus sp.]
MRKVEARVRPSFLYLLTFLGMAICLLSSLGYNIQEVPLGTPFGMFGLLPFSYWVGIIFMVMSLAIGLRSESETLFYVQALILFMMLWSVPAMFQQYPTVWDSYVHYDSTLELVRAGTLPNDDTYSYAFNYPGFFVFGASYVLLGNPDALLFLRLYPVFASILTVSTVYIFTRTYVPKIDYRLAFLFAAFANVWLQFNYSPQSMGFVAGLMIFVCLEREGREWLYAAMLLFAFIVISHPTTLIFVLGAIALKEILARVVRVAAARRQPIKWGRPWPVGVFILIWLGWFFTGASSFSINMVEFITNRLAALANINESVQQQITMRTTPENILGVLYPQLRTGMVAVFAGLTVLALIVYLIQRRKGPVNMPRNILALFLIALAIIPLDIVFFNGQLYDRGILYIVLVAPLVFVPLLLPKSRRFIRPVLGVLVALVVVAAASTMFYQETLYITNSKGIAAADHLSQSDPAWVAGGFYPIDVWSESGEQYQRVRMVSLYNQTPEVAASWQGSGAFLFDQTTENWYRQWGIQEVYTFYEGFAPQNYKVYDNGNYWVMYVARSS